MPNLKELNLEDLKQEVVPFIIENCPNISHLILNNYRPSPHDKILKDLFQKLHITHLTIKFPYKKSIIFETLILSKELLPTSLNCL
ncbi:7767_t:CDS:1, partial [Gigaspora margarita]